MAKSKSKTAAKTAPKSAAKTVTIDRRSDERRESTERREKSNPVQNDLRKLERRKKVNRRRQIDPTTCERDYSTDEIEFMQSLDEYKRSSGRMFPTCSEILEVVRALGYVKQPVSDATPVSAGVNENAEAHLGQAVDPVADYSCSDLNSDEADLDQFDLEED